MAKNKSAEKRHQKSLVRRTRNRAVKSHIRNASKKVHSAIASGEGVAEALRDVQSILQKAASKKVLHRNTAARQTARLARRAHKAASST